MRTAARRSAAALLLAGIILAAGCASPNASIGIADRYGHHPGFFFGIWHGLTSPVSLVGSALTHRAFTIYEVRNSGTPYEAGFLLGALAFPSVLVAVVPRGRAWFLKQMEKRRRRSSDPP